MAGEISFDIVNKIDRQEVDNALNMAAKEIRTRFDFKGTDASIRWSGETVAMEANGEERVKAILDVFKTMLIRRKVDIKSLATSDAKLSGKTWHITASLDAGINADNARKLAKLIRDEAPKGVRTQIQGDELRVFSKKRDDLQFVQQLIREQEYEFAVQFANYR
ncbi:MAG: YajQ family cyclic di-GMP-binding protein [Propionibacteriaceae bacterium]|nr:YajQ family cyclic di-GMP-binding protein [Propionibacteriaceae bacterium]